MKTKKIPQFKSIREEAVFWDTHAITDYWGNMEEVEIEFIPQTKKAESVTIRLEPELKKRLEKAAKNNRVSLSTIARLWLIDRLRNQNNSAGETRSLSVFK